MTSLVLMRNLVFSILLIILIAVLMDLAMKDGIMGVVCIMICVLKASAAKIVIVKRVVNV